MHSALSRLLGVSAIGIAAAGCAMDASPAPAGALLAPAEASLAPDVTPFAIPAADLLPVLRPGWEAPAGSAAGVFCSTISVSRAEVSSSWQEG